MTGETVVEYDASLSHDKTLTVMVNRVLNTSVQRADLILDAYISCIRTSDCMPMQRQTIVVQFYNIMSVKENGRSCIMNGYEIYTVYKLIHCNCFHVFLLYFSAHKVVTTASYVFYTSHD